MSSRNAEPTPRACLRVGFILAENFTLSAFSLFVDHLRLAADKDDNSRPILCQWQILGSRAEPVRASCGVAVARTVELQDPTEFDYIVVVGGLLHGKRQVDDATTAYLRRAAQAGTGIIGLCTGVFVLCRAGVMRDRVSCVSWYHRQDFMEEFPDQAVVSEHLFHVDGDRITCSGGGGSADLAMYLIEKHLGRSLARKASHVLLLDRPTGSGRVRLQPHPPVIDEIGRVSDARVRRAMMEMEQNMLEPLAIADIAARLDISARQLERLFHSVLGLKPMDFYRLIRLRYARSLLEQGELSVTEVAVETGFSDCAHFSRQFKSMFGHSPSGVRKNHARRAMETGARVLTMADERAGVRLF